VTDQQLWTDYLNSLSEAVTDGRLTQAQLNTAKHIWTTANLLYPTLKPPAADLSDGVYSMNWAYPNIPKVIYIDIYRSGRFGFFSRTTTSTIPTFCRENCEHLDAEEIHEFKAYTDQPQALSAPENEDEIDPDDSSMAESETPASPAL
jgi:hypothetical protein